MNSIRFNLVFAFLRHMEGFDAIYYEEEIENNEETEAADVSLVPDPVIIRGAGNMTVYVKDYYKIK